MREGTSEKITLTPPPTWARAVAGAPAMVIAAGIARFVAQAEKLARANASC